MVAKLQSNNPTINNLFTDLNVPVSDAVTKFETGNREIEHRIDDVLNRINVNGRTLADLGSGTGIFIQPMINAIGPNGRLYASEPASKFKDIIHAKIQKLTREQQKQVTYIHSTETDVKLPLHSCDVITCFDVYHHFEYLEPTLTSIRNALKPNGRFIVCDFYKDLNEWSKEHVRCDRDQSVSEILSHGFVLEEDFKDLLKDNWLCIFKVNHIEISARQSNTSRA